MSGSPVVVLDIGASKVLCLIGESSPGDDLRILGMGHSPCNGMRRSAVIDMPKLVEAIRLAVREAERSAGMKITGAYAGLAGEDISSSTSQSVVAISGITKSIDEDDLDRVNAAIEQGAPDEGQVVLHRFVQSYAVDGELVQNPLWLHGNKLELDALTVTASRHACTTLQRAAEEAGIEIVGFILETMGAASAAVTRDEREMGVGILDLGAGTSDLAIFRGSLRDVIEVPFGGEDITKDLSIVLNVSLKTAEQLKRQFGCVCCQHEQGDEEISFQTTAGRQRTLTRYQMSEIIEARQQEILEFMRQHLEDGNYHHSLAAGLIFTGGGALLQNISQLGEEVLGMPVRLGPPLRTIAQDALQTPQYTTAIGMLRFVMEEHPEEGIGVSAPSGSARLRDRIARLFSFF